MKRLDRWIDGILRDVLDFLVEFWAPSWTWRRPVYNSTPIVLLIRAAEAIICERHLDWLKQRINTMSPLSFFLSYVLRFEHSLATSILEQWSNVNFRDCLSRIVCNTEPPWKSTLNFLAGVANIISITRSWVYWAHSGLSRSQQQQTRLWCCRENHPSGGGRGWSWPLWILSSSFTSTPNNPRWLDYANSSVNKGYRWVDEDEYLTIISQWNSHLSKVWTQHWDLADV